MAASSTTPAKDIDAVKADLESLRSDLGELTSSVQALVKQEAQGMARAASQRAHDADEQAQAVVREHPYQSVGAAFVAGFVIGKLLNL